MTQGPISPVVLVILDGWGYREDPQANAIAMANTPVMDSLCAAYPNTLIRTSGKDVGLPQGQMGNSEVGHLNIGAGRVVPQELVRISDAVEDGTLLKNPALIRICESVRCSKGALHLIGLCSEGGVHSHLDHLFGLVDLAKSQQIDNLYIHAITDGRDTKPKEALAALQRIEDYLDQAGLGQIATLNGRYYAMDRDKRWNRVQLVYDVMTTSGEGDGRSATELLKASYEAGVTDEFVVPIRVSSGSVQPGDGVIFFNFRPDRARQLTQAFVDPEFDGFERDLIDPLSFATFTQYNPAFNVDVAFEPQNLNNILGEVIASHGLKQLRTAETEKYAHVTYFFNGGVEEPFDGEIRELIPSPMVPTYDKDPKMSAQQVTQGVLRALRQEIYSFIVVNYANPDMVGHTGNVAATVEAIDAVDQCLGQLLEGVGKVGGSTIIIADHGNAEYMQDEQGNPWTAHTTNMVPFILVEGEKRKIPGYGTDVVLRSDGRLADIAPTILQILGLPKPPEMTGQSMIKGTDMELTPNRTPVSLSL